MLVQLFPLLVIALAYDILSGDRERGTLALLLSQPLHLRDLLAAKALKEIPFLMSIPESTEYLHLPIGGYYAFLVVISAFMFVYFTLRAIAAILAVDVPEEAPADAIEEME